MINCNMMYTIGLWQSYSVFSSTIAMSTTVLRAVGEAAGSEVEWYRDRDFMAANK